MTHRYALSFKVRDYECDLQGIVNNSVYQNYLEHTRHEFLLEQGLCFSSLSQDGIHFVVTKIELNYLIPLRSKDSFTVSLDTNSKGRIRGEFIQAITRDSDGAQVLKAKVECVALNQQGRPFRHPQFIGLFVGDEETAQHR